MARTAGESRAAPTPAQLPAPPGRQPRQSKRPAHCPTAVTSLLARLSPLQLLRPSSSGPSLLELLKDSRSRRPDRGPNEIARWDSLPGSDGPRALSQVLGFYSCGENPAGVSA